MRLRNVSVTAVLVLGLLGSSPTVPAAADEGPRVAEPLTATVPETVTARLDAFAEPTGYAASRIGPGVVSAPTKAEIPFSMIGLELPVEATARVRTSVDGETWGGWMTADHLEADDGPDRDSAEMAASNGRTETFTEPLWVNEARWVQVEVEGAALADVAATFLDPSGLSAPAGPSTTAAPALSPAYAAAGVARPAIMSRAQWGANESYRKGSVSVASGGLKYAVVHHTAGGNTYSAAQGPEVVRGIYKYHTQTLGWSDIGYNVLVDRYGRIYEGRAGGLERAVVGAHAQGFNTGSVGVSVMGNFEGAEPPQAALESVAAVLAWKLPMGRIDPKGKVTVRSGGSNKYPSGQSVVLDTITAHRNVGQTACPGANLYSKMPSLRNMVMTRIFAGGPTASAPPSVPTLGGFTDIGGSVHADNIVKLVDANVTIGCAPDRFCPLDNITRGQAAVMFVRATPGLPVATGQAYSDVPVEYHFAPFIWMATRAGLMSGYPDGTFRPSDHMTREQVATVLGKAAGLQRRPGQFFNDVPWVSPHLAWVNAIGEAGISTGCGGGAYCPANWVTRQEMASFMARGMLD